MGYSRKGTWTEIWMKWNIWARKFTSRGTAKSKALRWQCMRGTARKRQWLERSEQECVCAYGGGSRGEPQGHGKDSECYSKTIGSCWGLSAGKWYDADWCSSRMLWKGCREASMDQWDPLGIYFSSLSRDDRGWGLGGNEGGGDKSSDLGSFLRGVSRKHPCLDYCC